MAHSIFAVMHPEKPGTGEKKRYEVLLPYEQIITGCLEKERLTLTKAHIKLARNEVDISYGAL